MKRKLHLVFDKETSKNFRKIYRLKKPLDTLELCILFLGKKNNKSEFHVQVIHEAPNTKSLVRIRSALFDTSKIHAFGNITIEKNAFGAEAFLEMRALLLGPKAQARFDPTLDIFENDVRASHAASVGRISMEELFYLQSRGFKKKEAEKILLKEYFYPMYEQV